MLQVEDNKFRPRNSIPVYRLIVKTLFSSTYIDDVTIERMVKLNIKIKPNLSWYKLILKIVSCFFILLYFQTKFQVRCMSFKKVYRSILSIYINEFLIM